MTRLQRSKYEVFLQVRDFVTAHPALVPESSTGGQAVRVIAEAIAQIERQGSARMEARGEGHHTAAARAALKQWMLDIAFFSRDIAKTKTKVVEPLTMPERANDVVLLAAANRFLKAGESFSDELVQRGLGEQWADGFKKAINTFETCRLERRSGRRNVSAARESIASALKSGVEALQTLDRIIEIALRKDPVLRPSWQQCRRIHHMGKKGAAPVDVSGVVEEGELEKAS